MSCHILEGDLWRVLVIFLKELRFRLTYVEDTTCTSHDATAHSSHDEDPDEDDDDKGCKVPQEIADEVVVSFVGDFSCEVSLFVLFVKVALQIVDRAKFHLDACRLLILVDSTIHLLLVLGVDGQREGVVILVDGHISHIPLGHKLLESCVINST